jgi:hypothetical protein
MASLPKFQSSNIEASSHRFRDSRISYNEFTKMPRESMTTVVIAEGVILVTRTRSGLAR